MQNYVLFTDTDTDITPEIAKEYGYHLISMPYSIDGKTIYPYEDFEVFDYKPYYDMLRGGVLPTTSAIGEERYKNYFEPVLAAGQDILYLHFSRAMSATFEAMDRAIDELLKKYPERKIQTLDLKSATTLSLLMIHEAGALYKAGKTADEILAWAEKEVDHFAMYMFVDDLKFFKRSGRVSGLAATMGTMLGIRPMIHISSEGKLVNIGKIKGRTKALEQLVNYVEELGDDLENHRLIVGNSDACDMIDELVEMLRERFGDQIQIETAMVNPTLGAHCGPDGIGVAFHAIHR
ncbi:MAG: DegV family protein [Ruminococcaceae bacterium]|nr:DegV family protein [Oscillospiraceae bacterium]